MKIAKMLVMALCLSFALVQVPGTAHAVTTSDAIINYVSNSNGTIFINANLMTGTTVTASNQNYVLAGTAANINTMSAMALSAIAATKPVKLQIQGGNWSNLYGIMVYP